MKSIGKHMLIACAAIAGLNIAAFSAEAAQPGHWNGAPFPVEGTLVGSSPEPASAPCSQLEWSAVPRRGNLAGLGERHGQDSRGSCHRQAARHSGLGRKRNGCLATSRRSRSRPCELRHLPISFLLRSGKKRSPSSPKSASRAGSPIPLPGTVFQAAAGGRWPGGVFWRRRTVVFPLRIFKDIKPAARRASFLLSGNRSLLGQKWHNHAVRLEGGRR